MPLDDLGGIIDKYLSSGKQKILKEEMATFAQATLEAFELGGAPQLIKVDDTAVRIEAGADSPAPLVMSGIPNVLHPHLRVDGGLSDGRYRINTSNVSMDFDISGNHWGNEKSSQWYAVYALAGDSDPSFTLKGMPWMRVKSQAGQVISLGTILAPGTGIGYGFTTDELVGFKIYITTGASRGLMRPVSANNNDDGTGGTITYSGNALSLAQGDWFIILPDTNFRWLGDIYNNASSNIDLIDDLFRGSGFKLFTADGLFFVPSAVTAVWLWGSGAGGAGQMGSPGNGGGGAEAAICERIEVNPGDVLPATIGQGVLNGDGQNTSLGAVRTLVGGKHNGDAGGPGGSKGRVGFVITTDPILYIGGDGGGSIFGDGGRGRVGDDTNTEGCLYGGGGGGGQTPNYGGQGFLLLMW